MSESGISLAGVQKDAKARLDECRRQKEAHRQDIEEGYFFVAPRRARNIASGQKNQSAASKMEGDADLLQISIGMEEAENFGTTLIQSFMPKGMNWIEQGAPVGTPPEMEPEVVEQAKIETAAIFGLMRESNFDAALAMSLVPDAAIGTHAMLIEVPKRLDQPVECRAVPLREMEINVGPDGLVNDRFLVKSHKGRDVAFVLRDITLPEKVTDQCKRRQDKEFTIRWGWWRVFDPARDGDEVWCHVVMVDDEIVHHTEMKGEGCVPLIVSRFNPHSEFAFGEGPAIRALPELRHLDDQAGAETENIDLTLRPPMTYPDDSFANIEDGVEPGMFYPIRPGTGGDVKKMFDPNPLDAAYFDQQARERRVRKLFYNDMPEQRGDTPPTATQWVDEMALAQRKIGTPGEQYWREGPLQYFRRFRYLAAARNLINITGPKPLVPRNPAQRAQDMQKASNAVRAAQVAGSLFPEEFKLKVDGGATIEKITKLMGAEDVLTMRDEAQIQEAAGLIGQVMGGQGMPAGPLAPGVAQQG